MLRRAGIILVGRRDGRAAVHWPHFWLLQGLLLAVQSTGVVAVALLVAPPAQAWLLGLMAAVIALNAFLVARRTREMLATPPDQLLDLDAMADG
ncbi:MAG: hypothetical protein BGO49_14670 [Planctomycetales bacterium 71-10]|nr:MAG: hypothetical protein BGO49_14670 [Planctomycetales bacterium 71-10]